MAILDNLQGSYSLDDSPGNLVDSSGNGRTLTNNNSVAFNTGKINQGADTGILNVNETLTTTSFMGLTAADPYTFNLWINVTTNPASTAEACFLSWCDNSTSNGKAYYQLKLYNNVGTMQVYITRNNTTGQDQIGTNSSFTLGTWYMLTYRWDTANHTLCVDGNTTPLLTQASTRIGSNSDNGGTDGFKLFTEQDNSGDYSGLIDIVGVWSRAITDVEMGTLYAAGAGIQYPYGAAAGGTRDARALNLLGVG